tara:strand:- start:5717 stop:5848 length:132 start_codon:yes stop_codon:yes gene_type:complete
LTVDVPKGLVEQPAGKKCEVNMYEKSIELLNTAVADEFTAIHQ